MNICEYVANDFLAVGAGELDALAEIEGVVKRGWGGLCEGDECEVAGAVSC
jgi:hypothetical protein